MLLLLRGSEKSFVALCAWITISRWGSFRNDGEDPLLAPPMGGIAPGVCIDCGMVTAGFFPVLDVFMGAGSCEICVELIMSM
jgi:hypothetical protein